MTKDAAVTAAAEAIDGPGSTYLIQRGHVDIDDVARVVAAARPIIEAEVREEYDLAMIRRDGSTYARLRERWEAEVRERIAADIEAGAWRAMKFSLHYEDCWQHHAQCATHRAARIARGQS